jgi:sugar phosphate isomerase/epimerase
MESNRRNFLGGVLAAAATPALAGAARGIEDGGLKLGVASYSFREFSRQLCITDTKALHTPYINIKEFHLPYRSTKEEIAKARREFEKAGLNILGGGTVYMLKDDDDDIRGYFEYARAAGMPLLVIGPSAQTMPRIEKFVKQYNIKVAIHNHGPEDKHFPTPESALKIIGHMDPRVGLCIDVGHTVRTGQNVVEAIQEAGPRLLDMHIKDLRDLMNKDSQVEVGGGAMPIVAIFKQLKHMRYEGGVMLEYEINGDNPLPGMQMSFSYMRGVLAGLKG